MASERRYDVDGFVPFPSEPRRKSTRRRPNGCRMPDCDRLMSDRWPHDECAYCHARLQRKEGDGE